MKTQESQKLYTTSEAAKAAGVPLATLQAWITTGVISAPPVQPHRGAGVRLWSNAQVRQIRKLRKLRQSSAFLKDRRARQAKTLRDTLAPDEARDRMSVTAKAAWTPERHTQASDAITNSWAVKAVRRRRIKGIKTAWTPERRNAQAAATAKIMADPEINPRRLAGLRRANADPELNALRIANLKKVNAKRGVRRRKIKKMKETLRTSPCSHVFGDAGCGALLVDHTYAGEITAIDSTGTVLTIPAFASLPDPLKAGYIQIRDEFRMIVDQSGETVTLISAIRDLAAPAGCRATAGCNLNFASCAHYGRTISFLSEVNARRSATSKKLWADFRAGQDALAEIGKARNRGRGRPRMEDRDREAARLQTLGYTARQIAVKLDPNFAKDPDASINTIRKALGRIRKSEKIGGSPDEPKTLHDG